MMSVGDAIKNLETEIEDLRQKLRNKEEQLQLLKVKKMVSSNDLTSEDITRYSRQIILPQISLSGQLALKSAKVLIVGAGGLGCPCALYLAAAGVGHITMVDSDEVELSNLHRQILHYESDVGKAKVTSAFETIRCINSTINFIPLKLHANSSSIKQIIQESNYNVVIDGSDNVATRYLLNDVCVIHNIPLVSGSALQMEGQLTVYGYKNGPCYRCLFPVPPPPESVTSCGDGGVLGVVPGTIGVLQALEAMKIIIGLPGVLSGRLLLFDGSDTTFRNVTLRKSNPHCKVCGDNPEIRELIDYEEFCGTRAHDKVENIDILKSDEQINVKEFSTSFAENIVIDVRPEIEYLMCKLPYTINIPYNSIAKGEAVKFLKQEISRRRQEHPPKVYVICRRGNDSQRAICLLKKQDFDIPVMFCNVEGGLYAYSKYVDCTFPIY